MPAGPLRRSSLVVAVLSVAALAASAGTPPRVQFAEVAASAGVNFLHRHGGTGRKLYIETLPPGVCWFDFDRDGWQDFYILQSGPLPGTPRDRNTPHAALYRNRGDGTFEDASEKAGVTNAAGYGDGCTVGDYDNDGDDDLYVTNFGPSVLYRNNGNGTFTDVTGTAGVKNGLYAAGAAWADYDNDGRLDLYVANYVDFTMDDQKFCGDIRKNRRSYCHPDAYGGIPDVLYHNEGNGRFKEVSRQVGMWDPGGKGLGVVWFDLDDDGDVDLYVANDATPNNLYRNDGNGRFTDITFLSGACCSEEGKPESGMGTDAGDVDGDGFIDLVVTNLSNETNQLYRNLGGSGTFSIDTYPMGLGETSLLSTSWGVTFVDYDNDTDLDLIMTCGHPMDDIGLVSDMITFLERPYLFENLGNGRFREIGRDLGPYFRTVDNGRGLATCDYDNDGDRDVAIGTLDRKAVLLRNDGGNTAGHWINLKLEGVRANRNAFGAKVTVTAGGKRLVREVRSASSFMSQNDMRLHVGLGAADKVDAIEIRWPTRDKKVEKLGPVAADQFLRILEGAGIVGKSPAGRPSP